MFFFDSYEAFLQSFEIQPMPEDFKVVRGQRVKKEAPKDVVLRVARGSFADNAEEQQAVFFTSVRARYVRFVALSAHDGGDSAAVSELDVILEENQ